MTPELSTTWIMKPTLCLFFSALLVSCNATSIFSLREETDSTSEQWEWKKPKVARTQWEILVLPAKEEFVSLWGKLQTPIGTPLDQVPRLPLFAKVNFSMIPQEEKATHPALFPPPTTTTPVTPVPLPSSTSWTHMASSTPHSTGVFQSPMTKQTVKNPPDFPPIPHQTIQQKAFPKLTLSVTTDRPPTVFIPPPAEEPLISGRITREPTETENQTLSHLPFASLPQVPLFYAVNNKQPPPPPERAFASVLPVPLSLSAYADSNQKSKPVPVFQDAPKKQTAKTQPDFPPIPHQTIQQKAFPKLTLSVTTDRPPTVFIPRPLDIVLIIDTSFSMQKRLTSFKSRFAHFLSRLSYLDWKLMITNADHGDTWNPFSNIVALKGNAFRLERNGQVLDLKYLSPSVPYYNSIFLSSISLHKWGEYTRSTREGTQNVQPCQLPPGCQSYKEQPLKSLKSALIKNPDFFRKEADVAVVLISNSQEQAGPTSATEPEEVIRQFEEQYGTKKRFEVYGLVIREEDEECLQENLAQQSAFTEPQVEVSFKIMTLSDMTGGEIFSLCSADYSELAMSIADSFGSPP